MSLPFDSQEKNFGFGFMRLPMAGENVDIPQTTQMVDAFLAQGFRYFDTAHGYINGKSELAIRECLTSRYPRDRYLLANKLSFHYFQSEADIRPLFQQQLDACGVTYFDYYLMHALSASRLEHFRSNRAFEIAQELRSEGKLRHIGISFHDTADVLDQILMEFPQIEFVQLQFNYLDYDDPKVQSRLCYEVCRKHGKPVVVMEPVKGGALIQLPNNAQRILDDLGTGSNASYAIRYAAGFEGIQMVLSGMSTLEQMLDNISFMKDFQPLGQEEQKAIVKVQAILRNQNRIDCTNCRYCTEVCPQAIPIPDLFSAVNQKRDGLTPADFPRMPECLNCGKCEKICPQTLPIRDLLKLSVKELV